MDSVSIGFMTNDTRTTQELPAVGALPVAEHEPHHILRSWDEQRCDLADTQELPAIPETRPASEWSSGALARLLADVQRDVCESSGVPADVLFSSESGMGRL